MRQLRPEPGEYIPILFQNTDPNVFNLFISLFLTYCIKEVIKRYGHPLYVRSAISLFFDLLYQRGYQTQYNLIGNFNILHGIPLCQTVAASYANTFKFNAQQYCV